MKNRHPVSSHNLSTAPLPRVFYSFTKDLLGVRVSLCISWWLLYLQVRIPSYTFKIKGHWTRFAKIHRPTFLYEMLAAPSSSPESLPHCPLLPIGSWVLLREYSPENLTWVRAFLWSSDSYQLRSGVESQQLIVIILASHLDLFCLV